MKSVKGNTAVLIMCALCICSALSYGQEQEKKKAESYAGTAIGTGGPMGGRTMQFNFTISEYTTDEEVVNFANLLKERGQDALRDALDKQNKGRINPVGTVGNEIAVARKRQVGKDTFITIVTARIMSFAELYRNGRTSDYPFGFMLLKLDENGKGSGQIMAACSIRFSKKSGKFEIESFGNQYIKAINIFPWK